jgi:hypothetical protein
MRTLIRSVQRLCGFAVPAVALVATLVLVASLTASAAHAQIWVESGDAGDLVSTAQITSGVGALTQIQGSLASPTDVDVYCVRLTTPPPPFTALIGINCAVIQGPNAWLFDAAGNGIASNATCSGGSKMIIAPAAPLTPGNYYVAVSYFGYDPQSVGGAIWLPGPPFWRAPDGPGAGGTLIGWAGTPNVQPSNPYQVFFNPGFSYCDAATPVGLATWGALKIRYDR